jgi:hypothetical protein
VGTGGVQGESTDSQLSNIHTTGHARPFSNDYSEVQHITAVTAAEGIDQPPAEAEVEVPTAEQLEITSLRAQLHSAQQGMATLRSKGQQDRVMATNALNDARQQIANTSVAARAAQIRANAADGI